MKVDEQFKCKDCDNYNLCKYYHNRRETSFICKEFQNQWGFIKELEAIKAEICQRCNDALFGSVSGIVDKHISELKGENNPDCRSCDKWKTCENGKKGHAKGTSIGYSIGECRDYVELRRIKNETDN